MVIGVDARPLSYRLTGIGYYLMHLLEMLQKVDRANTYVLISNKSIPFELNNRNWQKVEGHMGVRLLSTLWMQTFGPYFAGRHQLDLFWGPRHHLPVFLPEKIKTVVTIHDLVHKRCPETMALENFLVERLLMKRALEKADAIIAVSRSTAADIRYFYRLPGRKISTIYPGVPTFALQEQSCGAKQTDRSLPQKYFLFVGTLEPRKNLLTVLKAFEKLEPEKNDINLVIAGNIGWHAKDWLSGLMQSSAKERVFLTGYVSRQVLKHLYENAFCLVFPSIYEGFGMPVLEAMAAKVPVITANFSAMAEVAGDAALLVNPESAPDIAGAMQKLLRQQDLRNDLLRNAESRLIKFSWETAAKKTVNLFEQVCRN
ncbi:MAG: glycosyltransferase family 1 protein [Desulfobacterales bacterium]|nr:glycosyltransferase family 1 protein [Desulfobacterales bacterium]